MYYRRSISKILSAVDDALDGVPEEKKCRKFYFLTDKQWH